MIYGLNFGAPCVTKCPVKLSHTLKPKPLGIPRGHRVLLVGITDNEKELATMLLIANNGRRQLFVDKAKKGWTGIYAY